MLNQNWFQDKRFVMFEDFAESQSLTQRLRIFMLYQKNMDRREVILFKKLHLSHLSTHLTIIDIKSL